MASWKYLPVLLIWTWMVGIFDVASACTNCLKKNDTLTCIDEAGGTEYQLNLQSEGTILELSCVSHMKPLNVSFISDCDFPDVEEIEITGCSLPGVSYGDVILHLGIFPENVTTFRVRNGINQDDLEKWHLDGMDNLMILEMHNNKLKILPEEFFVPTTNLRFLKMSFNSFTTLPASLFTFTPFIETINLESNEVEVFPDAFFVNLTNLREINLSNNYLSDLSSHLFIDSSAIESLDLSDNRISRMDEDVFQDMGSLKNLTLLGNLLTALPEGVFSNLISLRHLDLSSNLIKYIPANSFDKTVNLKTLSLRNNSLNVLPDKIFIQCRSLQTLILSDNNLKTIKSEMFPIPETSLSYLDLGKNNLSFARNKFNILVAHDSPLDDFPLSRQIELKVVILNDNKIEFIPSVFNRVFLKLKNIDLSGNQIEYFDYHSLRFFEESVTLNLKNNKIKIIDFHDRVPPIKDKEVILFLEGNELVCDCRLYAFSKIVQGKPVGLAEGPPNIVVKDIDNVHCRDQDDNLEHLNELDLTTLTCTVRRCIGNCTCLHRPHDWMLIVNCDHLGLTHIPNLVDLPSNISVTLNLQNNSISSLQDLKSPRSSQVVNLTVSDNRLSFINETDIPNTLKILDVRGNNLTSLTEPLLKILNETDMILSLGNNPWPCDCGSIDFLNFLHVPSRKVTDFEDIKCADGEELLLDLNEYSLCPFFMQPMVIVSLVAIAVFLLLFAVLGTVSFYKYKQGIKVWLFAHRFCLWAITEDEMDANKKYDAFISYSHKDEEFVNTVLVPKLESEDPKYRICLHYRDWIPGEYIQNQILQSVEASRRTIVILSSNFIESVWGQLEFKAAHSQALQDKTNRIIVIVYGEIPPESELDEKLQLYISMKTYIKWGDAKFWEKLRYAMPHPPHLKKGHRRRRDTDKLELVKSDSKGGA
ncbi:hypothetical protein SK128_021957 [Halocaridina rubra]|uniref:TIR domain-containing protein n=1 Tax=Halocaridina rubra TaxID=373956 RepID=A0AAN8XU98_HALRR